MMGTKYDFLIVGAGLTGVVLGRELTDSGATCLIIDRRPHVGGNVYDYRIDDTLIHKYGPHIFHTDNKRVWKYVNKFSEWMPYEHRVKAKFEGKTYSFPPNLLTYDQLGISPDDPSLKNVLFDVFFRGYSSKQWGCPAKEVPRSIIERIPIRYNYDDRYFSDMYQGLPSDGYTAMVKKMLSGISVETDVDFFQNRIELERIASRIIYTGPLDSLYSHDVGKLEYRSLKFENEAIDVPSYQGSASINFTGLDVSYTRIHEWRYFGWQKSKTNIITREYPQEYGPESEPYYPVNNPTNNDLYRIYRDRAKNDGYIVAGRLGEYRYYDMHQAIASALHASRKLICC